MKLIVEELVTDLTHSATANRRMTIAAVRPFIYKHRSPSGTFTVSIIQGGNTVGSKTFTSAQMESEIADVTSVNFFHGPYKIEFDSPIVVNRGSFDIKLSHSGYSFSETDYIGWVREHERTVNDFAAVSTNTEHPKAVEVWEYKR